MHFRDFSNVRDAALGKGRELASAAVRARPTAAYIARLTITATVAYLIALLVPAGTSRPVLAPLTALLVLQATVFHTVRAGLKRVAGVTVGVLVAVGVSAAVPFSWWLLGLLIAVALTLGHAMRLGDDLLEVPISAMLIFSAVTHKAAATGRIVDTLVGTVIGLAGGLVFARLRTQPAREAVGDLASRLGDFVADMADGLRYIPSSAGTDGADADVASIERDALDNVMAASWLDEAHAMRDEIERVDDALRAADESARLNPRALGLPADMLPVHQTALRAGLGALEQSAAYLRGLARSVIDSARIDSAASPVRDTETRSRLADVLGQLGLALRTYGRLIRALPAGDEGLETQLSEQLGHTRELQDGLAELLEPDAGRHDADSTEWPLRGEILAHLDRLRTGLRVDDIPTQRDGDHEATRPWAVPHGGLLPAPEHQAGQQRLAQGDQPGGLGGERVPQGEQLAGGTGELA
jgi:hypothetical protein